jgi:glycosyltransferase involved in cell wall biosynthesis
MKDVVMIYVEPAPYIVGLVKEIRHLWNGSVDALYIGEHISQTWTTERSTGDTVLPTKIWSGAAEIWRRLKSGDYRLLHLAGWGHPLLLFALVAALLRSIPIVVESDTPAGQRNARWRQLFKRVFYPLLFRFPKGFLPGGQRQAHYLRQFGVEEERIQIAQMTVDVVKISNYINSLSDDNRSEILRKFGLSPAHVRFLYLGRLEPHKGLQDLFAAFNLAKHPKSPTSQTSKIQLLIAGGGSLQSFVEDKAKEDADFRYVGRLENDAVKDAYAAADVFVLPSRFEPWGLVVNEAMAAGLPVIVTERVGCVDDLVTHELNGLVIPAENPPALADAMRKLADDSGMRQHMGFESGRIISGWTLKAAALRTIEMWQRISG